MKTVLITGCSSGFGRSMVDEFLNRGWRVIATLRHADTRQDLFADHGALLAASPGHLPRLITLSLDVTNPNEREAVRQAVATGERLDALINNAGYGLFGALENLDEDQLRHQMEVNFFGAALLTRSLLPWLRQSHGSLIFISSTFGYLGFPLTSAYCASKFALEGLAESLYYELQPHGVRVALIEPGASRSKFGKNGEWGNGDGEAYRLQGQGYQHMRLNIKARAKNLAPLVATRAADLAEGRSRRFRSRVGQDGAIAHAAYRLAPEGLRHAVLSRLYQRLFLPQEKP